MIPIFRVGYDVDMAVRDKEHEIGVKIGVIFR